MASSTVSLEGLPELKAALAGRVSAIRAAADAVVAAETEEVAADARRQAPRGATLDLVDHIEGRPEGLMGVVKSTSRHAGFMEYGTFKDEAQPSMGPAAEASRRRFPERATSALRAAAEGA